MVPGRGSRFRQLHGASLTELIASDNSAERKNPGARAPGFSVRANQIMIPFIESDHDLIFCLSMIFFRKTGSHFSGSCSKDAIASAEDRNRAVAVRSAESRF